MTDVAAPNERDPEIHEAFLSLACAILCFRRLQSFQRPSKTRAQRCGSSCIGGEVGPAVTSGLIV